MSDDGAIESRPQWERLVQGGTLAHRVVRSVSLREAALAGLSLQDVRFDRCLMQHADFDAWVGTEVSWQQVDLRGARWGASILDRCQLQICDGTELYCGGALWSDVLVRESRLSRVDFGEAQLKRCVFERVELASASFQRAKLAQCRFVGFDNGIESLARAVFADAWLVEVSLRGANLYGSTWTGATLVGCDLSQSNLCAADLRGARFVRCRLDGVEVDAATLMG